MRFYQWLISAYFTKTGKVWLIRLPDPQFDGVWLGSDCEPIENWDSRNCGKFPGREFIHVDYQPCEVPIMSDRLRSCVESVAPGEAQFLPLSLVSDQDGSVVMRGYFVGHILNCLACIDQERTQVANGDWTRMSSGNYEIRGPMTLRRHAVENYKIFRADGSRVQVFVREDVKIAIEEHSLTGSRFEEVAVV